MKHPESGDLFKVCGYHNDADKWLEECFSEEQ